MKDARRERSLGKTRWIAIVACVAAMGSGVAAIGCGDRAGSAPAAIAKPIPELPVDAARWVNGAPVSIAAQDKVLFVESWHPA